MPINLELQSSAPSFHRSLCWAALFRRLVFSFHFVALSVFVCFRLLFLFRFSAIYVLAYYVELGWPWLINDLWWHWPFGLCGELRHWWCLAFLFYEGLVAFRLFAVDLLCLFVSLCVSLSVSLCLAPFLLAFVLLVSLLCVDFNDGYRLTLSHIMEATTCFFILSLFCSVFSSLFSSVF